MITRNLKPRSGRNCCDSNKDNAARTCKKLPVASFCASETAETGRIANGREQGDHVSRRQGGKGFNWACVKLLFCALIRGLQNLESPFEKGFNFVRAKSLLWWADLRFAEPRSFPERETVLFFSLVRKERGVPQRVATLWTPGDDSKLCRRRF